VALIPRCRPSVGFIATVRTRFSPRCCSTSTIDVDVSRPLAGHAQDGVVNGGNARRELDVETGPMT
jgi:hypothetical protein